MPIVAGILGLVYSNFTYTKETHDVKVGPLELTVKKTQTVNVPAWAGVGDRGCCDPASCPHEEIRRRT